MDHRQGRSTFMLVLSSAGFVLFIGPGLVAGIVPWLITRWHVRDPLLGVGASQPVGVVLVAGGAAVMLESVVRFMRRGRGTLVPTAPTQDLVISGLYRFVRNPMYVGVLAVVLGEALLFGSPWLLALEVLLAIVFHLFVVGYEEPTLRRAYGEEYDRFCSQVPRWLPRPRRARP